MPKSQKKTFAWQIKFRYSRLCFSAMEYASWHLCFLLEEEREREIELRDGTRRRRSEAEGEARFACFAAAAKISCLRALKSPRTPQIETLMFARLCFTNTNIKLTRSLLIICNGHSILGECPWAQECIVEDSLDAAAAAAAATHVGARKGEERRERERVAKGRWWFFPFSYLLLLLGSSSLPALTGCVCSPGWSRLPSPPSLLPSELSGFAASIPVVSPFSDQRGGEREREKKKGDKAAVEVLGIVCAVDYYEGEREKVPRISGGVVAIIPWGDARCHIAERINKNYPSFITWAELQEDGVLQRGDPVLCGHLRRGVRSSPGHRLLHRQLEGHQGGQRGHTGGWLEEHTKKRKEKYVASSSSFFFFFPPSVSKKKKRTSGNL